jgi:adenine-specific DNA-methyltransferase
MLLTDIVRLLGKPHFQAPNCLIYHTDCLQAMAKLPDECVNLTVTSPPYNIGQQYKTPLPLHEDLNWCERWIAEIYRLTLPRVVGAGILQNICWGIQA